MKKRPVPSVYTTMLIDSTGICKSHSVSNLTEPEMLAVARWTALVMYRWAIKPRSEMAFAFIFHCHGKSSS